MRKRIHPKAIEMFKEKAASQKCIRLPLIRDIIPSEDQRELEKKKKKKKYRPLIIDLA